MRQIRLAAAATLLAATACTGPAATAPAPEPVSPGPPAASTAPRASPGSLPAQSARPPEATDPPPGRGPQRYLDQQVTWRACEKVQCATVLAPLDYAAPDRAAISLALARRPGTASRRDGALFVNPGGPGGSGVDYVQAFDAKGLETFDIVGWDPRGVGGSAPVRCFSGRQMADRVSQDQSPDNARERSELLATAAAYGRSCLERSGDLVRHISTTDTVRDLDLLRHLLGEPRLDYLGFSYGTRIGALYAELYGPRVGRMVLDGAVNITGRTDIGQLDGFERALGEFADWCAGRRCRLGNDRDRVLDAVSGLLRRLDSEPVRVGRRELTQTLALDGLIFPLYFPEASWSVLEEALARATEGDGRLLLTLADEFTSRKSNGEYGQDAYAFSAIRCVDQPRQSVAEAEAKARREAARAPVLGPFFGFDAECALWPVPATPPRTITARRAPPILVVGTTGDPATPYEYAEDMADRLPGGVLLTFRGEGHLGYRSSTCVARAVQDYLVRGRLPRDGTTC